MIWKYILLSPELCCITVYFRNGTRTNITLDENIFFCFFTNKIYLFPVIKSNERAADGRR